MTDDDAAARTADRRGCGRSMSAGSGLRHRHLFSSALSLSAPDIGLFITLPPSRTMVAT